MSSPDPKDRRVELIAQARAEAEKSDNGCAPCTWYVCDWKGYEDKRNAVALLDALKAAEKFLSDAHRAGMVEAYEDAAKMVAEETELPDDMPDPMWEVIRRDRDACSQSFRIVVRKTKENCIGRIRGRAAASQESK